MLVILIAVVGVVVGIIAHLILGDDGYSWFGEIILGIAGATVFGMLSGIPIGERQFSIVPIIIAAAGAAVVEAIAILVTFRTVGRGFGQSER